MQKQNTMIVLHIMTVWSEPTAFLAEAIGKVLLT